ncbi:MAG: tetratricopeptide repeat protein [Gemmatimonadetes bacterium]|nr:tetratricopeptide repeat protein [Gemmatimonadota bacterium]
MVHSHADLVRGLTAVAFDAFEHPGPPWTGGGAWERGALFLSTPTGEPRTVARCDWRPGGHFAIEFLARFDGGPADAALTIAVPFEEGMPGLRVLLDARGYVAVDRVSAADEVERVLAPTPAAGYGSGGWNRIGIRGFKGKLAVVVGGREVGVVPMERSDGTGLAFLVAEGGRWEIDQLARYERRFPRRADGDEGLDTSPPLYFEAFSHGRDDWLRGAFRVQDGALSVRPGTSSDPWDLLLHTIPVLETFRAVVTPAGESGATVLFGARADEGALTQAWIWDWTPDGGSSLRFLSNGSEQTWATVENVPSWSRWGSNDLRITHEDSLRFTCNGVPVHALEPGLVPAGAIGFQSREQSRFRVDEVIATLGTAPARGRGALRETPSALWEKAVRHMRNEEHATAFDALRNLYFLDPELRDVLPIAFREAVRAGEPEEALTAAHVMQLGEGERPSADSRQIEIIGLLTARRFDEAYGALGRYRADFPSDAFALENTLLMLDREKEYDLAIREFLWATEGSEPLRATGFGVAAHACYRLGNFARALETIRLGLQVGPGRLDLLATEADILRKLGDIGGALARYERLLADGVTPIPRQALEARLGVTRFETGDFAGAGDALAQLPSSSEPSIRRARNLLRAISLYKSGVIREGAGREDLEEAHLLAQSEIHIPPVASDAVAYDLLGRIEIALALLDLAENDSYEAYRLQKAEALASFERAGALDPSFAVTAANAEVGRIAEIDPARYAALLDAAMPQDHPIGGFIEDPQRWSAWYVVDKKAALAERAIGTALGTLANGGLPDGGF